MGWDSGIGKRRERSAYGQRSDYEHGYGIGWSIMAIVDVIVVIVRRAINVVRGGRFEGDSSSSPNFPNFLSPRPILTQPNPTHTPTLPKKDEEEFDRPTS